MEVGCIVTNAITQSVISAIRLTKHSDLTLIVIVGIKDCLS
jgi:hypothetical protein